MSLSTRAGCLAVFVAFLAGGFVCSELKAINRGRRLKGLAAPELVGLHVSEIVERFGSPDFDSRNKPDFPMDGDTAEDFLFTYRTTYGFLVYVHFEDRRLATVRFFSH